MPPEVVAVVPTYNEAANLPTLAEGVLANGYRLLVVDDASPDGTGRLAEEISRREPRLSVLHRPRKEGLGKAYAAGFERALEMGADIVCELDADFSHDPVDLPRLVREVQEGADVALGSRYVPGGSTPDWPPPRRLISRGGNLYARLMLGLSVRDATGGFRAFRQEALRKLRPDTLVASGYGFQVEMVWRAEREGLHVVEVPIVFRDRRFGESKMSSGIVVEAMGLVTRWGVGRLASRLPWSGR